MSRILVGVDGSEDSRRAVRWASAAADALGVDLRAIQAWQYPATAILSSSDILDPRRAAARIEAELRELLEEILGADAERVEVEAGRGPAAVALLHAAGEGAEMVVVGSRGLGGFKGLLLGSVGRQLCEHAPCAVTVVRRSAKVEPVRLDTIVVGTDGSPDATRALRFAGDLATRMEADLVVAHAASPGDDYRLVTEQVLAHPDDRSNEPKVDLEARHDMVENWCAPLRDDGVDHRIAVVSGDARNALLDAAHDNSADLLVVGSRGHGPVKKMLLGSVAAALIQHSEMPVTVVPQGR